MKEKKLVSVVLPVHNTGMMLMDCITSLFKGTKMEIEIILVESESTDGTAGLCDLYSQDERFKVFHTKKEGLISAMNFGIKQAKGDYVLMTQADVIFPNLYTRDWLEQLCINADNKECGIATTANGGGISGKDYLAGLPWAGTWCMLIPRKTLDRVGLFDENFNPGIGDDIDYSYRVYLEGFKIFVTDFTIDHHRKNEHFNDSEELKIKHSKYFREKHKL